MNLTEEVIRCANAVLANWPDSKAMKTIYNNFPKEVRRFAAPKIKAQQAIFKSRERRYFCWCTARPDYERLDRGSNR